MVELAKGLMSAAVAGMGDLDGEEGAVIEVDMMSDETSGKGDLDHGEALSREAADSRPLPLLP